MPHVAVKHHGPRARPCSQGAPDNRQQWRGAHHKQHGKRRRQQRPLRGADRALQRDGVSAHRCGQALFNQAIAQRHTARQQHHAQRQHARLGQFELMRHQRVDFHLHRRKALPAKQQRQPKAGEAIQKNQTQGRRQPRQHCWPLHAPKRPPWRGPQRARRCHARGAHLPERIDACAHDDAQVEKQIAVQQQPRRVLQINADVESQPATECFTDHAARPPQRQHAQPSHQRGHHKRQHQQTQHQRAARKLIARQNPRDGQTEQQRECTSQRRLHK